MPGVAYPSSRAHSERTIAVARVALAATALFAIWLDPADTPPYSRLTYSLYVAYVAYSAGLLAWTTRLEPSAPVALATHVVDIAAFSVFQYLTLGPSSPFFVYFIFSMFCGAIRWGWRGTLVTGALVMGAYLAMAISMEPVFRVEGIDGNRFIIRLVYLIVATGMLVYLGRYEARLRLEIERLARWPAPLPAAAPDQAIGSILEYGGRLIRANCILAIWEVGDEPSIHEALWANGAVTYRRFDPGTREVLTDPTLGSATVICKGPARAPEAFLVADLTGRLIRRPDVPLPQTVLSQFQGDGMSSAPLDTDIIKGRVFFADLGVPPIEAVALTEVVAREIASSLDQFHSSEQRQEIAAREERIRVARDLHDGVLQGLTGVRLELRALAKALGANIDESTRNHLVTLERALALEQRELRLFISGLEPGADRRIDRASTLASRLDALRERLALEWKTPVTLRVSPRLASLPPSLDEAVPLMVHEAAVNALKHAQASRVAVDVDGEAGQLRIAVTDDGRGFPFKGRYNHEALAEVRTAPRTLFERVSALGGQLSVESTETGSRVEMHVSY
ncbi:MAG: sensor histidine kinase [Vicinamibacterales bacterium]